MSIHLTIRAAVAALLLLAPTVVATAQNDIPRQRIVVGEKQVLFPPLVGEEYPDLPLINANGDSVWLSSLKGKAILIQYIDMRSSICQAYAGSAEYGAIGEAEVLEDVHPIGDYMGLYGGGLAVDDPRMTILHLLVRNLDVEPPAATDVSRWEARFGIELGTNKAALGISQDLIPLDMDSLVPGFDLLDEDMRLAARSSAAESKKGPSRSFMKKVGEVVRSMPTPTPVPPPTSASSENTATEEPAAPDTATAMATDSGVFSLSDGDLSTYEATPEELATAEAAALRNQEASDSAAQARLREEAALVQPVNSNDFTAKIIENPDTVILFTYAPNDQRCREQAPVIQEMAKELRKVKFFRMDVSQDNEAIQGLEIKQVPTLIMFRAGSQVSRKEGLQSQAAMQDWIKADAGK